MLGTLFSKLPADKAGRSKYGEWNPNLAKVLEKLRTNNHFKGMFTKAATVAVKINQQCARVAKLTQGPRLNASSEVGYTELDRLIAAFHRESMETAAKREAEKEEGNQRKAKLAS